MSIRERHADERLMELIRNDWTEEPRRVCVEPDLAMIEDRIAKATDELEECAVLLESLGHDEHEIYEAVQIILASTRSIS